ncbi:hypothetical protein [Burkholderia multivorans]|uniref:hypothetical protein n=1 Tax=Burkholderia multivorans TaxID=87883 RepID=UPI0021C1A94E|nr:hypothetical protein [Burkholderia multivorans]
MNIVHLKAQGSDLRVIAERVADAFQKVANEMPVEGAIRALCPSHLRAQAAARIAA